MISKSNRSRNNAVLQRCRFPRQKGRRLGQLAACIPLLLLTLAGCSGSNGQLDANSDGAAGGTGTLLVEANGEDFVRDGFTEKDGWRIDFDHVYVTMTDVTAAQTTLSETGEPEGAEPEQLVVYGAAPVTVDLAAGDGPTKALDFPDAPSGRYNALSWQLVPAEAGPAEGYPIMMIGTATKEGESVSFEIGIEDGLAYTCGDFVGDERKGILDSGKTAAVEATFHFDHVFGDAEAPANDKINIGALGFAPLAAIAQDGQLTIDSQGLQEQLSERDYGILETTLLSLGHVGEGHCGSRLTNET